MWMCSESVMGIDDLLLEICCELGGFQIKLANHSCSASVL